MYDAQVKHVARIHWVDFSHVYADRDVSWSGSSDKACLRAVRSNHFTRMSLTYHARTPTQVQNLKDILLHIAVDIPYAIPQSPTPPTQKVVTQHIPEEASSHVFDFSVTNSPQRKISPRRTRVSNFSLSSSDWNSKDEMLRMVIVVHRHGARFPKNCRREDLAWPQNSTFYDRYSSI